MAALTIEQRLAVLEAEVRALKAGHPVGSAAPREVNLDTDKYANFTVRRSPKNWLESGGHDYAGTAIADTPPEFCDALAEYLDWTAAKDEEKNYSYTNKQGNTVFPAKYARIDAARARAWARRLRAEAATAARGQTTFDDRGGGGPGGDGDEIPFIIDAIQLRWDRP